MTFDVKHDTNMPSCTCTPPPKVPDAAEGEHLVYDAAVLMAAAHVADRHMIGIDHADQFGAWTRLADHAQTDQTFQSMSCKRGTVTTRMDGTVHVYEAHAPLRWPIVMEPICPENPSRRAYFSQLTLVLLEITCLQRAGPPLFSRVVSLDLDRSRLRLTPPLRLRAG